MGWPQHIRGFQIAARRVLLDGDGSFDDDALSRVVAVAVDIRDEYHLGRVLAGVGRAKALYARLALAMDETASGSLCWDEMERLAEPTLKRIKMDPGAFLARSLRAGLLSRVAGTVDSHRVPIPSLARYLRGMPGATPKPGGGDMNHSFGS